MTSAADEPAEPSTEHAEAAAEAAAPRIGMSPYATGGGGVTFERKVAVGYLALLLTREGATELGEGRSVVSVAFQQAPDHPIDDLVVRASRAGEGEVGLVLALAVRRAPNIVQSDDSMRKLTREFVRALVSAPTEGTEYRFALMAAGWQVHSSELASLASTAAAQMDAPAFFGLIRTPGKFPQDLARRLDHVVALVKLALEDLGTADLDTTLTNLRTWELLSRLVVLMPRLETPDESDWTAVQNRLVPVARGLDLAAASRLRDRLLTLADDYPPKAATVDQTVPRRDVHGLLDTGGRRNAHGWAALDHLHQQAIGSMRDDIVAADGARRLHVDRSDVESALLEAAAAPALVVHGESGVGKSALTIRAATAAAESDADAVQVRCINLRQLPPTSLALESALGAPLAEVLDDLSAPSRMIIIDGADAVAEGQADVFRYVIDAAQKADVSVVAVTATDNKQVVHDTLTDRFGVGVVEYVIPPLTDVQLSEIVETFAELRTLAANARSRELLRRLVVTDLLVRSGVSGVPLSDADAMRQVWACLVRRREHTDRGMPDARELVLLHPAGFALSGGNALAVATDLDAVALDGLRRDGLLRASADNEWQILPEFSHDEIRRYAVARLLLVNGDPAGALVAAGAPRWALPAARLACQAVLDGPDRASQPIHGRFERLQAAFDALVDSGRGARWGDVPAEALLAIGDPAPLLADAWQSLRSYDASGLKRLGRLIDQRHRKHAVVDAIVIEPIITLLLDAPAPWWSGEYIANMLREWLHALVLADAPRGQPLRVRLRERLVAACDAGDARLVREREEAAAARAARTPEEIEEERERMERNRALFSVIGHGGRERRDRPVVAQEGTDDTVLEVLALLGPDLGDGGERILRRVSRDAPWHLASAVEEALTGRALASFGHGLLADLTEAYYLDEEDDSGSGLKDDGIRDHHTRGLVTPLCAWYRGPFMPLFQTDLRRGVVVLNRMLNHAARVRVRTLAGLHDPWGQVPPGGFLRVQNEALSHKRKQGSHRLPHNHHPRPRCRYNTRASSTSTAVNSRVGCGWEEMFR